MWAFLFEKWPRIRTTLCRNDQPPLHIVTGVIEVPWDIFNLPRELTSLAIMQFTASPPSTKYIISSWRKGKDFDFIKNNNSIFNPSQQTNDLFVCTEIFPEILLSTTMSGNNLKPDVKNVTGLKHQPKCVVTFTSIMNIIISSSTTRTATTRTPSSSRGLFLRKDPCLCPINPILNITITIYAISTISDQNILGAQWEVFNNWCQFNHST